MLVKLNQTTDTDTLSILEPLGVFFLVLFLLGAWFSDGHGASLSALAQVQPGMSRKQVIALLGTPGTVNRESNGSESWFYGNWTFCQVKVYVSSEGLVSGTDHDH
jgi:hypothetical protein